MIIKNEKFSKEASVGDLAQKTFGWIVRDVTEIIQNSW